MQRVWWLFFLFGFLLVPFVFADNGCCGQTLSGDTCLYTAQEDCATPDYFSAGASCTDASFCGTGCCIMSDGACAEGAGEYSCSVAGGAFFSGQTCSSQSSCTKVCCQLNSDYTYETQGECDAQAASTGIAAVIHDVSSESECSDLEHSADVGCCVTTDGCTSVSEADCGTSDTDSSGYGFYTGESCASVSTYLSGNSFSAADSCQCSVADGYTACDDLGDVVQYDSCGNKVETVQDCTYPTEVCSTASGQAACEIASCDYTVPEAIQKYNPELPPSGTLQNGQRKCLYTSPAGNYQDRPGSRHYVLGCYSGELSLEPCADYRNQVCVETTTDGYTEANCVDNTVDSTTASITTVPKGEKFWDYYNGADTSSSSCNTGVVTCDTVYGKSNFDYAYECDANCFCLRNEWTLLSAEYCNSKGDCGYELNTADKGASQAGFEMQRDRSDVGANFKTDVGCGENCIYDNSGSSSVIWDAVGLECYPGGSLADCKFYTWDQTVKMAGEEKKISELYYDSLLNRKTGSVYLFTLLEYVGIIPSFFKNATEYAIDTGDYTGRETLYDGGAAQEIIQSGLHLDWDKIVDQYYQDNSDEYGEYIGQFIADNPFDSPTWEDSISTYRNYYGFDSFNYSGNVSYIYGAPFSLTDITDPLAKSPEYDSRTTLENVAISSSCSPWTPPLGSDDCHLCEEPMSEGGLALDDGKGNILVGYECSEYLCKSLGTDCEYVSDNVGSNRPVCIATNPGDTTSPVISLWTDAIDAQGYSYTSDPSTDSATVTELPVNTLVQMPITTDDYTRCKLTDDPANLQLLTTGITTDELYDSLTSIIEDPSAGWSTTHNFTYALTESGTEHDFWIYCKNFNNLVTITPFEFKMTTTTLPDTTPPEFEGIIPATGSLVPASAETQDVSLYLNEPSVCRYSTDSSASFDTMDGTFPSCSDVTNYFEYVCQTTIPLSSGTSTYYFLCEDTLENKQTVPEEWTVSKTEALDITQTSPSGTLYSNDVVLQVNTAHGGDNGNAVCTYQEANYAYAQEMYITSGTYHEQTLSLDKGDYSYAIVCTDDVGNTATSTIAFTIDKDETASQVNSVYYLGNTLYVITNEASTCQANTESFSYGGGTEMAGVASIEHTLTISDLSQKYYIACIDAYGNEMSPITVDFRYLLGS